MTILNDGAEHEIVIPSDTNKLHGLSSIPENAVGLVLFEYGSGISRFSPRNRYIAH